MRRQDEIRTIGDFLEGGYGLFVSCDGCRASAAQMIKVDLGAMARRLGTHHDLYSRDRFNRLLPMICSGCGSRKLSWIVSAPCPKPTHSTWGGECYALSTRPDAQRPRSGDGRAGFDFANGIEYVRSRFPKEIDSA
jgi:hypothetical protein